MIKFLKWIHKCFTAETYDGAVQMWHDATPEERVQLTEYWKTNPMRMGSFQ